MKNATACGKTRPDTAVMASRSVEAEHLFYEGRLVDAEAAFREVIRECPDDPKVRNDLACLLWSMGRRIGAVREFLAALQIAPDDRDVVWNIGQVFLHVGQGADARDVYRAYLRKHPGDREFAAALREWNSYQQ
jgi:Flp pilus assembly protein TadD